MGRERRVVRVEDVLDHRYLSLRLVTERSVGPDGRELESVYVHGSGPDVAYCVPLFDDGTTVLLRQRRYGLDAPSLEVPGGHVDPGESPSAAALRELREETGLVAGVVEHVLTTLLSIKIQQRLHFHVARGLVEGAAAPDPDEEIETVRVPLAEAVSLATSGAVRHGPSVTALLLARGV